MIAAITTGGKQYVVREGDTLHVELIHQEPGQSLEFAALLTAQEDGTALNLGKPQVSGALVKATIIEHGRGDKVLVVKYKAKVRYRRHNGHRQPFTTIKIDKIAT